MRSIFDAAATQAAIQRTLADADIPAGHTVAIVAGGTIVNGQGAAGVVVAVRAGEHWRLAFDVEHTAAGDNGIGFAVKASW